MLVRASRAIVVVRTRAVGMRAMVVIGLTMPRRRASVLALGTGWGERHADPDDYERRDEEKVGLVHML